MIRFIVSLFLIAAVLFCLYCENIYISDSRVNDFMLQKITQLGLESKYIVKKETTRHLFENIYEYTLLHGNNRRTFILMRISMFGLVETHSLTEENESSL